VLISPVIPLGDTDDNGFVLQPEEIRHTVYANRKSVGHREFYESAGVGYITQMKFDVFSGDFGNQGMAEYEGKRYKILRTYIDPKSGEFTELTLSDLSQRGDDSG